MLRFGGTIVAGLLGLGALYFTVLCNGLSFENKPAKVGGWLAGLMGGLAGGGAGGRAGGCVTGWGRQA